MTLNHTFRRAGLISLAVSAFAAIAACSSGSDTSTPAEQITWSPCQRPTSTGAQGTFECGTLKVPLDWARPNGEKITLALTRAKATDTQNRLGAVLMNPGGPGEAALGLVNYAYLSERVRARFDTVAMDPRGVGGSTPVKCPTAWTGTTLHPQSAAEFDQMKKANADYYQACKQATGDLIDHVDTVSVVRDVEAVRKALGEKKLNFVGLSYGTAIAAEYARVYPDNSRALVLDGVLEYQQPAVSFLKTEAAASEDELSRFAAACKSDAGCALYGQDPLAVFDQTVQKANAGQLQGAKGPVIGETVTGAAGGFLTNVGTFSPPEGGWSLLASSLSKAQSGDGTAFEKAYDYYQGVQRAITCLDKPVDIASWAAYGPLHNLEAQSPHLAGNVQTWQATTGCIGWGAPALAEPVAPPGQVAGQPMLLVTATHDPSTPAAWAESVHERYPGSSLIYRDGDGHTSYATSECIRNYVDDFLISGKLPASGQMCAK